MKATKLPYWDDNCFKRPRGQRHPSHPKSKSLPLTRDRGASRSVAEPASQEPVQAHRKPRSPAKDIIRPTGIDVDEIF